MKLSTIIITRNEEENIAACIDNLKFSDEIIVVDNNSSDKTVKIAKEKSAKVYNIKGLDFSYLRNIGKEKASFAWLFYIDADERVTPELEKNITSALNSPKNYSAYKIIRKNYFLGKPWPFVEKIARVIKKDSLIGWQGSLHESPIIAGKVGEIKGELLHFTHRDLASMVDKTNEWSEIEAQLLYKSNHPPMSWWRFFRIMITSFYNSYIKHRGWKMGVTGFIESIYQSFSSFITYTKLWEKQNRYQKDSYIRFEN